MISKRIHCTIYLEGVNVNFNSVQIQERTEGPPIATVSFPADSGALTTLPKTVLHVFYRDDDGEDVLIFMGELASSGISFTADKRSIQLTFLGLSQNWHTNVVIPMDTAIRIMLSNALYAQITPSQRLQPTSLERPTAANAATNSLKNKPFDEVKAYIAQAESSNDPYKVNKNNSDGTWDSGLYQINDVHLLPINGDKEPLRIEIDAILLSAGVAENAPLAVKQAALLNSTTNEKVAAAIYKYKGLQAWSTRDTVKANFYKDRNAAPAKTTAQEVEDAVMPQSSDVDNKIDTKAMQFINVAGTSILTPIIKQLIEGHTLLEVLTSLVDVFSTNFKGVYWSMLSKAFDFKNMVKIVDHPGNKKIETLLKETAVMEHINSLANGTPPDASIHTILTTILNAAGFDYCEIAAPSNLGSTRAHILIKPKTHFFPPLKHNLVVDDNIAQLSFNRTFDAEPTRLIAQTLPFFTTGTTEFERNIMSVVIPAEVNIPQGIKATIDGPKDYENLKMFGLSREEQCRGVVLASNEDHTKIEEAFLVASLNDFGKTTHTIEEAGVGGPTSQSVLRKDSENFNSIVAGPPAPSASDSVRRYWLNLASAQFYDKRHAARSVQVNSPFSPYRMVGFPGAVISKYFPVDTPAMVGILDSLASTISADGEASQTLVFTHCRLVDGTRGSEPRFGFLDDDSSNLIPWYADYANKNSINQFYQQFTGDPRSAIVDVESPSEEAAVFNGIKNVIDDLKRNLVGKDFGSIQAYMLNKTKRALVTRSIIDKTYPNSIDKVRTLIDSPKITYESSEIFPYVQERRDRVIAVFDVVKKG